MTQWIFDTLVWTGLLIALVLLVRRSVGRYFGAKAAYALWALPLLRLLMPPLVLPAWLATEVAPPEATAAEMAGYSPDLAGIAAAQAANPPMDPAATALPIAAILLTVWLTGAAIFLALRFSGYFKMRRSLLEQGRPVGEAGAVRLIETPQATAPLAFGVLDKVVALPIGFMALYDREQRDFALAHELAHHSGRDLLANMAVQPLFALHWFNPLGWLGWRALRRDQEAACDARVIASRSARDKAAYAQTIAGFAAGPHLALAAPMACPVLGEKSIIHRLRSISMSDISPRRRLAGRALIGAGLLALPLTASISYAETRSGSDTQAEQPPLPPAPPEPLAPPAPPSAPGAPEAPTPPAPPEPPSVDSETDRETRVVVIERSTDGDGNRKVVTRRKEMHFESDGRTMSPEERAELRRELKAAMAEVDSAMAEAAREHRIAMVELRNAQGEMTKLKVDCEDGAEAGTVCKSEVYAHALAGIEQARREIASSNALNGQMLAEVLAALDAKIAQLKQ